MTDINKDGFEDHINKLDKKTDSKPHDEILKELLDSVEVVKYLDKAFPKLKKLKENSDKIFEYLNKKENKENEDYKSKEEEMKRLTKEINSMKLLDKHFLIISVNEIIKKAKNKKFGLCLNNDLVYLYNGEFWKNIDVKEFEKFLGEASFKMGVEKFTAEYFQFREKLFKQFTASGYLTAPKREKNKVFINLLNGTFEITDKPNLRGFKASDFIKYQLPFAYDEKATAPKFMSFLERVLPEKDKQNILSEFLGYVFVPHSQLKLEKALFLFGSGANGKSVFYEVIKMLLGPENTSSYSLQNLTDLQGNSRAKIADKLVNYSSEINGKLESDMFKKLCSGEAVQAKLLYKDTFEIEDYAKLIFNTNELPKDVEFTKAFFRRFIIIPFEVTIPEKEQNADLHKEIIKDELPGVFNWVLDGLKRLLKQKGFSQSPSIDKALDQYMTESDTVKRFLEEEGYKSDPIFKILLKDLYQEYKTFALDDGNRLLSKQNFRKRLEALKIYVKRESLGMMVFVKKNDTDHGETIF
jgi:putative DNA primase/helicase